MSYAELDLILKDCHPKPHSFKNISGLRSGKLVARAISTRDKGGRFIWVCDCDCGGTKLVRSMNLVQGRVKSCGCLPVGRPRKERA